MRKQKQRKVVDLKINFAHFRSNQESTRINSIKTYFIFALKSQNKTKPRTQNTDRYMYIYTRYYIKVLLYLCLHVCGYIVSQQIMVEEDIPTAFTPHSHLTRFSIQITSVRCLAIGTIYKIYRIIIIILLWFYFYLFIYFVLRALKHVCDSFLFVCWGLFSDKFLFEIFV